MISDNVASSWESLKAGPVYLLVAVERVLELPEPPYAVKLPFVGISLVTAELRLEAITRWNQEMGDLRKMQDKKGIIGPRKLVKVSTNPCWDSRHGACPELSKQIFIVRLAKELAHDGHVDFRSCDLTVEVVLREAA